MPRGGTKGSSRLRLKNNGRDEDANVKARNAVKSIRFCYRSALVYVLVDVATTLFQNGGGRRYLAGSMQLTGVEAILLVRSLAYLNFGAGLWYAAQVYLKALEEGRSTLSMTLVHGVLRKMAYVWRTSALFLVMSCTIIMYTIKDFTNQDIWGYAGPLGVIILAIVGRMGLQAWSTKVANEVVVPPLKKLFPSKISTFDGKIDASKVREMGFKSARNMAFCMGAFYLLGLTHCFVTVAQPAPLLKRIFSVSDILTPVATAKLLGTLHRRFVAVVVESTSGSGKDDDSIQLTTDRFFELNEAQAGLYGKIATTINSNTVVGKIVPLIVGTVRKLRQ
jgi:hypothetical protein